MKDKPAQIVPKGLLGCAPRPTEKWHTFLTAWNRAVDENDMCAMLGRLHEGFILRTYCRYDQPEYGRDDILLFYISLAHGWCDSRLLKALGDNYLGHVYANDDRGNRKEKSQSEMRQVVAQKAMDMLMQNFFKFGGEKGERADEWQSRIDHIIASERLFKALVSFFAVDETLRIPNLTPHPYCAEKDRNFEVAKSFLLRFAVSIWQWHEQEIWSGTKEEDRDRMVARDTARRKMLDEAKPWALEVLNQFRKLHDIRDYVSEADVAKIREMALRAELCPHSCPVSDYRRATTVEEAYVAGSHAGWFLVGYEARQKELARLKSVLDADEVYQEAQRKEAARQETIHQLEAAKEANDKLLRELRGHK